MGRGLKRIIKRSFEEFKSTIIICKKASIHDGLITLKGKIIIQKLSKNGFKETEKQKKVLLKKHEIMLRYFDELYKSYLNSNINIKINNNCDKGKNLSDKIWICWWQGIENAPRIVKTCIESIRKYTSHEIIIIDEKNLEEYISFPDFIKKKFLENKISRTHLSDILRMSLLAKYGGLWLDSTFFCTKNIDNIFNNQIWSIKRPNYLHCSVASGFFANYSLYSNKDSTWFYEKILNFLLFYWSKYDYVIDYLMLDYMIVTIKKYDEDYSNLLDSIMPNNRNCDELFKVLNDKFESDIWNDLKEETYLFKLSWKFNFKSDNVDTFYDKLINNQLD